MVDWLLVERRRDPGEVVEAVGAQRTVLFGHTTLVIEIFVGTPDELEVPALQLVKVLGRGLGEGSAEDGVTKLVELISDVHSCWRSEMDTC